MGLTALGVAAMSGGLGLLSGVTSAIGTKYAADKAYQTSKETNAQNYKIFQESKDFERESWNLNNAYNSPENQRALLESAGYNPYSLFEHSGSEGQTMTTPTASPMTNPSDAAFQSPLANGVSSGLSSASDAFAAGTSLMDLEQSLRQSKAQIDYLNSLKTKNDAEAAKINQDKKFDAWLFDTKDRILNLTYKNAFQDLINKTIEGNNLQQRLTLENKEIASRTALNNLGIEQHQILNKYLDESEQLRLCGNIQDIIQQGINHKLTLSQIQLNVQNAVKTSLENKRLEMDNKLFGFYNYLSEIPETDSPLALTARREAYQSQIIGSGDKAESDASLAAIQVARSSRQNQIEDFSPDQIKSLSNALFNSYYWGLREQATASSLFQQHNSWYDPNLHSPDKFHFGRSVNTWWNNYNKFIFTPLQQSGISPIVKL